MKNHCLISLRSLLCGNFLHIYDRDPSLSVNFISKPCLLYDVFGEAVTLVHLIVCHCKRVYITLCQKYRICMCSMSQFMYCAGSIFIAVLCNLNQCSSLTDLYGVFHTRERDIPFSILRIERIN